MCECGGFETKKKPALMCYQRGQYICLSGQSI